MADGFLPQRRRALNMLIGLCRGLLPDVPMLRQGQPALKCAACIHLAANTVAALLLAASLSSADWVVTQGPQGSTHLGLLFSCYKVLKEKKRCTAWFSVKHSTIFLISGGFGLFALVTLFIVITLLVLAIRPGANSLRFWNKTTWWIFYLARMSLLTTVVLYPAGFPSPEICGEYYRLLRNRWHSGRGAHFCIIAVIFMIVPEFCTTCFFAQEPIFMLGVNRN